MQPTLKLKWLQPQIQFPPVDPHAAFSGASVVRPQMRTPKNAAASAHRIQFKSQTRARVEGPEPN